jgi:hypothetical protein
MQGAIERAESTHRRTELSDVTIVIEWENPRDVDSVWTDRGMRALADELAGAGSSSENRPTVLYLFDSEILDALSIHDAIERGARELNDLALVRVVPAPGLTYYQLKNEGVAGTETPYVILLDSDVCPQPGWLRGLLRPFADPEVMAVSGVTSLEWFDVVSRTMALIWIFDLPSEHEASCGKVSMHANNSAFRTQFFQANPFPETSAFKKQCGLWLADMTEQGFGFERTAEAECRHAPHAGLSFVLWRGIQSGFDRDAKASLEGTGRLARLLYALRVWVKKSWRSTRRILVHHKEVQMPLYELPVSLAIAWLYCSCLASAQATSAILDGIPDSFRLRWSESS